MTTVAKTKMMTPWKLNMMMTTRMQPLMTHLHLRDQRTGKMLETIRMPWKMQVSKKVASMIPKKINNLTTRISSHLLSWEIQVLFQSHTRIRLIIQMWRE